MEQNIKDYFLDFNCGISICIPLPLRLDLNSKCLFHNVQTAYALFSRLLQEPEKVVDKLSAEVGLSEVYQHFNFYI